MDRKLSEAMMRQLLSKFGHDPDKCPTNDKEFAKLGIKLLEEWKDSLPRDMQIPMIALTMSFSSLMAMEKHDPTEKELECLQHMLCCTFNMGYRMGQLGLQDPYHNPAKPINPELN